MDCVCNWGIKMRTRRRDLDYLIIKQSNQAHENIRQ